ncbi:hypothetical protein EV426DRAFT_584886 [Tirmania nivea]|nr:hypothetical protein EV426DRAFT_584886 [Tirmania nivea]
MLEIICFEQNTVAYSSELWYRDPFAGCPQKGSKREPVRKEESSVAKTAGYVAPASLSVARIIVYYIVNANVNIFGIFPQFRFGEKRKFVLILVTLLPLLVVIRRSFFANAARLNSGDSVTSYRQVSIVSA